MPENNLHRPDIDCPSAQPTTIGARIFGVVVDAATSRRVAYLTKPRPVTSELLALTEPVRPTEVYRAAAPCLNEGCRHFAANTCSLAQRIVAMMDEVVDRLPRCQIRRTCRWFHQEGKAACLRCPQVVTERPNASEVDRAIAADGT
jgi:hypothetical protein